MARRMGVPARITDCLICRRTPINRSLRCPPRRAAGRPPRPHARRACPAGAAARGAVALMTTCAHLDHQQVGGHYDSSFTMKTHVHASDDDLKQGRQALAKIHHVG